jgi:hypothetical protein
MVAFKQYPVVIVDRFYDMTFTQTTLKKFDDYLLSIGHDPSEMQGRSRDIDLTWDQVKAHVPNIDEIVGLELGYAVFGCVCETQLWNLLSIGVRDTAVGRDQWVLKFVSILTVDDMELATALRIML